MRRLRRLLGAVQLPVVGAAGDGPGPQAPDQSVVVQQGLLLHYRLLPELCDGGRRRAEEAEESRHRRRTASRAADANAAIDRDAVWHPDHRYRRYWRSD